MFRVLWEPIFLCKLRSWICFVLSSYLYSSYLVVLPTNSESTTCCNQTRILMEELGHKPSHKTVDSWFVLPTRCAGVKDGAEFEGRPNQWLVELEIHAMQRRSPLTLLIILCYACRQEPHITVSWDASSTSRWRQMQRLTAKHLEGSLVEEWGIEVSKSEETPHENLQNQLTRI